VSLVSSLLTLPSFPPSPHEAAVNAQQLTANTPRLDARRKRASRSIHHASPQQQFNEGPSQNSELSTSENYQKYIWAIGQNKTQIEPKTRG
jgi:hypothetical protein